METSSFSPMRILFSILIFSLHLFGEDLDFGHLHETKNLINRHSLSVTVENLREYKGQGFQFFSKWKIEKMPSETYEEKQRIKYFLEVNELFESLLEVLGNDLKNSSSIGYRPQRHFENLNIINDFCQRKNSFGAHYINWVIRDLVARDVGKIIVDTSIKQEEVDDFYEKYLTLLPSEKSLVDALNLDLGEKFTSMAMVRGQWKRKRIEIIEYRKINGYDEFPEGSDIYMDFMFLYPDKVQGVKALWEKKCHDRLILHNDFYHGELLDSLNKFRKKVGDFPKEPKADFNPLFGSARKAAFQEAWFSKNGISDQQKELTLYASAYSAFNKLDKDNIYELNYP